MVKRKFSKYKYRKQFFRGCLYDFFSVRLVRGVRGHRRVVWSTAVELGFKRMR